MNRLITRWNNRPIEDDGPVRSKEFRKFASEFRHALQRMEGWKVEKFSVGHYNCAAFLSKGDHIVYISHDVPRGEQPLNMYAKDPFYGILYRTAKDLKDYRGGENHFTNFAELESALNKLVG